jgi:hypothetical protein
MRVEGPRLGYESLQLDVLLSIEAETGDHATNTTGRIMSNTTFPTPALTCDGRCRCASHLCAETSHTAD